MVGTLWGAYDIAAAEIAVRFYHNLLKGDESEPGSVWHALHQAIVQFRRIGDNQVQIEKWGPFVH